MEDNNTNKSLSILIFAISYRRQNLHKIINNKKLYGMDKYKAFSQLFDVPTDINHQKENYKKKLESS